MDNLENVQSELQTPNDQTEDSAIQVEAISQQTPKRKRRQSKRKSVKPNGMQNIRLSVTIDCSDQMIEIADKRGMPTTLALYRLYIEQGIEQDLKRLSQQVQFTNKANSQDIDKLFGFSTGT